MNKSKKYAQGLPGFVIDQNLKIPSDATGTWVSVAASGRKASVSTARPCDQAGCINLFPFGCICPRGGD